MKISTQTECCSERFGDFEAVKLLCETGYDAIDYSMFAMRDDDTVLNTPQYESHVLEVKKIVDSYGKYFNQSHAPFASMRDGDDEYNKKMFPRLTRAIEIAGILGAETIIVHPVQFKESQFEKNMEFYNRLLPYAKEAKVKIALENMWAWDDKNKRIIANVCSTAEDFPLYVDALPREHFTACLDIGHCSLVGDNAPNMIRALGHDRLTNLHVHDNDNVHDSHQMPFTMDLEWKKITKALAEIDYTGDITLEADGFIRKLPSEIVPAAEKCMYLAAKKVRDMVEKYKAH